MGEKKFLHSIGQFVYILTQLLTYSSLALLVPSCHTAGYDVLILESEHIDKQWFSVGAI